MKSIVWTVVGIAVVVWVAVAHSAEFKAYPGAQLDEPATQASQEALNAAGMQNTQSLIYTTQDSFENVAAFYGKHAQPYAMPGRADRAVTLPTGQNLQEAYFIGDGASNLASSKLWIKVQRPYIGKVNPQGGFEDVRDGTAIMVSQTK